MSIFKRRKEQPEQPIERSDAEQSEFKAFYLGQTLYRVLRQAAAEHPQNMQVRTSHLGCRYTISVGFPNKLLETQISQYPAERGELLFQVFVDAAEEPDKVIQVAYGKEYHASLTPLYARDPRPEYDDIEAIDPQNVEYAAEILANEVRDARRTRPTLADLFGEPGRN